MKTLASFLFLAIFLVLVIRAHQWRTEVLERAERVRGELRVELDEMKTRFEGYWPRYERIEDALGVASNRLARLQGELEAERATGEPLRMQLGELSAERVAQAAREQELRGALDAAKAETAQLKGSVEDVQARHVQTEKLRKELEEKAKALEEGLRGRDSDLAQLRMQHERQTAEFGRLQEANKAVPELQNQLAASKTERDTAQAERDAARKDLVTAQTERDQARKDLVTAQTERDQARKALAEALAERIRIEKERDAAQATSAEQTPTAAP